jgi:hypothetical protein
LNWSRNELFIPVSRSRSCPRTRRSARDSLSRWPFISTGTPYIDLTGTDIEPIVERPNELHPQARSRIISDNGPQFIARDFKDTESTHPRG